MIRNLFTRKATQPSAQEIADAKYAAAIERTMAWYEVQKCNHIGLSCQCEVK